MDDFEHPEVRRLRGTRPNGTHVPFVADDAAAAPASQARRSAVRTETFTVSPAVAAAWLEKRGANRPLIARNIEAIAWDIKHGNWKLTHQSIAFNRDGQLVDGQHRLHAIVAAGATVPVRVTFDVDCDYSAPIDTGCMRKVHHLLGMSHRRVAVCNALRLLESGSADRATAGRVAEISARHERGIDWALGAFPQQRRLTANVLAAHAFAYPVAPDLVADFASKLVTGANIDDGSAVLTLRRHLDRIEAFTTAVRAQVGLVTLRCLQAHCAGERLGRVSASDLGFAYFVRRRAEHGHEAGAGGDATG